MLHTAAPADGRSALDRVEEIIGVGARIESAEFERKTGYKLQKPDSVDCHLWDDVDGEWIAIAFDREHRGAVAYKSNIRR